MRAALSSALGGATKRAHSKKGQAWYLAGMAPSSLNPVLLIGDGAALAEHSFQPSPHPLRMAHSQPSAILAPVPASSAGLAGDEATSAEPGPAAVSHAVNR